MSRKLAYFNKEKASNPVYVALADICDQFDEDGEFKHADNSAIFVLLLDKPEKYATGTAGNDQLPQEEDVWYWNRPLTFRFPTKMDYMGLVLIPEPKAHWSIPDKLTHIVISTVALSPELFLEHISFW